MCLISLLLCVTQIKLLNNTTKETNYNHPQLLSLHTGFSKRGRGVEEAGRGQQLFEEKVRRVTTRTGKSAEESWGLLEGDWRCWGASEETWCKWGKHLIFFKPCLLVLYEPCDFFIQDIFGQLDHRMLSVFLKACDELTDILPQEEQQGLQETVRRLHKHWKVRRSPCCFSPH